MEEVGGGGGGGESCPQALEKPVSFSNNFLINDIMRGNPHATTKPVQYTCFRLQTRQQWIMMIRTIPSTVAPKTTNILVVVVVSTSLKTSLNPKCFFSGIVA